MESGARDIESVNRRIADLENQLIHQRQISERLELVVESAPNGIIVSNKEGRVLLVNQMAEKLFGYSREEFLQLSIEDLVPHRVRQAHHQNREDFHTHLVARRMGAGRDLYAMRKDGSEFPVEIGLTPLPNLDEVHVLSTIVDISQRKLAEDELRRYAKELERSNAELEVFAAVASHDLQEPLRKIRTMGERLVRISEGELSEKGRDYLARMIAASERMHHFILDLLTFSRVSTRSEPSVLVNLKEVVVEALSALEINIEETGAEILVNDLPAAEVDRSQMRQVFQNLIGNGLKFSHPDRSPHIELVGRIVDEKFIEIDVKDNGIGFDEKYVSRIFVIFQRLHGRSEYPGTGIGLAICKKIVERHGGTIAAKSKPGEGSIFTIALPREQRNNHQSV